MHCRKFESVAALCALAALSILACNAAPAPTSAGESALSANSQIGINVVLNTAPTSAILADLGSRGKVRDAVTEIRAVTMQIASGDLSAIRALSYVASASPDAKRDG